MTYAVKLESFEGPLDLLLHLIAKAQVDIKDIFVSEITDQYPSYLEQMEQLDMEQATEFFDHGRHAAQHKIEKPAAKTGKGGGR